MQLNKRLSKLESNTRSPNSIGPIIRHFISPNQGDTGKSIAHFPGMSTDAIARAEGESREQFEARAEQIWGKRIDVKT